MPTPCYISITGQTQEILLQVHLPLILSATSMCRGTKTRCWCRNSCITLLSRPILSPVSLRVSVLTSLSFYRGAEQSGSADVQRTGLRRNAANH